MWIGVSSVKNRHLMIAFDAVFPAGIHKDGSADDVCIEKYLGIFNGTVHMALRSKIHDHVRVLFFEQAADGFPVRDALLYKAEVRIVHDRL